MNSTFKKYLTLIILGFAGGSIYAFPYMKYVFYDPMVNALHISNGQAGFLLSMYAMGCMILYIPGGILADKMSPKKALICSLLGTTALTVLFAITFNYTVALVIWLLLAFSSGFVFWSALLKAIRMIGNEKEQGRLYGVYYASNGITATLVNYVSLEVFSKFKNQQTGFFWAMIVMAAFTGVVAVLLMVFMKEDTKNAGSTVNENEKFHFSDVTAVLKNPTVWIISIIFFCTYGIYTSTSYFTPYLTDVMKVSVKSAGVFGIIRTYVFMLVAPISGYIADKFFKSTLKWFVGGFILFICSMASIIIAGPSASSVLISALTLLPGLFSLALYNIMFSIMSEVKIPIKIAGTAIGIASICGYAPDLFLNTIFGNLLDKHGNGGYSFIFATLVGFCVISIILCIYLYRSKKKADLFAK
jgi:Sugar phosphate permease